MLSKIACNRLQKELVEWQVNPPAGFKHKVTDNLQRFRFRLILFFILICFLFFYFLKMDCFDLKMGDRSQRSSGNSVRQRIVPASSGFSRELPHGSTAGVYNRSDFVWCSMFVCLPRKLWKMEKKRTLECYHMRHLFSKSNSCIGFS